MKPFFTYFGGKYRVAPYYPAPMYETVVEPFAGAAGYSARHPHQNVILIDKNPIIAGLWKYLTQVSAADVLALPDLADGQTVDDLAVCQEAKWLIGFWLNKGAASPCKRPSQWMLQGRCPDSWWGAGVRQRVANQVDSIRHWTVIEGDYWDAPVMNATWFIDPPYETAGKNYAVCLDEYSTLAEWCRLCSGQVIVCEAEGATWLPFEPFRSIKTTPGKNGKSSGKEVVWLSDVEHFTEIAAAA